MSNNHYIEMAAETLKQVYCVEIKDENAFAISTDPESLPFAFIVMESKYPDVFLMSLRIGYNDPLVVADITLALSHITKLQIVDEFYIDEAQTEIVWGKAAQLKSFEQKNKDFLNLEPINNLKH
jgi:hypothetical protein